MKGTWRIQCMARNETFHIPDMGTIQSMDNFVQFMREYAALNAGAVNQGSLATDTNIVEIMYVPAAA